MKKTIVLGKGSFVASHLNHPTVEDRLEPSLKSVKDLIDKYKSDVIINCIAFTGTSAGYKNIDGCEADKPRTVMSNLTIPTLLAMECERQGIHLINMASGCIFYGPSTHAKLAPCENCEGPCRCLRPLNDPGWKETDFAQPLSFYSKVKYAADLALADFPNVFTARLRMPISSKSNPRNLINKLLSFDKVLDEPNSVTFLSDLSRAVDWAIHHRKTGVYHITNPEPLTHPQILEEYKKYFPEHSYTKIDKEQLKSLTTAPRSNCILDSSKLKSEGFEMTSSQEILEMTMKNYVKGLQ